MSPPPHSIFRIPVKSKISSSRTIQFCQLSQSVHQHARPTAVHSQGADMILVKAFCLTALIALTAASRAAAQPATVPLSAFKR